MINRCERHIKELEEMKHYPKELFFKGDLNILNGRKVSIVGSRKPNQYAREFTHRLSAKLAQAGVIVVSGGAIGTDVIAHKAAGAKHTVMVAGTGLDKYYPAINKNIIKEIESDGLVLSQFQAGTPSQRYNFPLRNELIVALGEVLIVMYADEKSGTMRSVEYAQKMGKEIFVLSHRIGESVATNKLLETGKAKAIYDIENFVKLFGTFDEKKSNSFLIYCETNPTYDEALKKFPTKIFESELSSEIEIKNGRVYVI